MERRTTKWCSVFLSAVLATAGLSGCGDDEVRIVYGPGQTHNYSISGTVVDEAGTPIEGIKASLVNFDNTASLIYEWSSSITSADGNFNITGSGKLTYENKFIIIEDIDGYEHGGEFKSDTISLKKIAENNAHTDYHYTVGTITMKK